MEYLSVFIFFVGSVTNTILIMFFALCLFLRYKSENKYLKAVAITKVSGSQAMYGIAILSFANLASYKYVQSYMAPSEHSVYAILAVVSILLGAVSTSIYQHAKRKCDMSVLNNRPS